MVKIYQEKETPVLRQKAKSIAHKDIGSKKLNKIIDDMKKVLATQNDGVAIAAPQVGQLIRLVVISGKVKAIIAQEDETKVRYPDDVFINPILIRSSREKQEVEEGCLSVRWLYGKVKRSAKVEVEAYDENGKKVRRGVSGLMAQIFQHEIDHLEGKLFIDTAKDLHEWKPEKAKKKKTHTGVRKELRHLK